MQSIVDTFLLPADVDEEIVMEVYKNVLKVVEAKAITSVQIAKYWDYYNNDFEQYLSRRLEETPEDFQERLRYFVKENHCRRTANIATSFLYGNIVGRHAQTDYAQNLLRKTWKATQVVKFLKNAALMSSVTGFATIIPHIVMAYLDGEIQKVVSWELVDSSDAIPIPDAVNPSMLAGLIVTKTIETLMDSQPREAVTFYSGFDVFQWSDNKLIGYYKSPIPASELICILTNPGDPMLLTGKSDIEDIASLNENLNKILTNMNLITDYYSDPILKLTGASLPNNWKKTANAVMELDDGADADFLTWDANVEGMEIMAKSSRSQIPIISGISSLSRSDLTNIGQIRTTGGIETAFKTDIETIRLKQIDAKSFDEQLHRVTLELYKTMEYRIPDPTVEVDFKSPERIIIRAGLEEAEAQTMEFNIGKMSPEDLYREMHPDSSIEEIKREAVNMTIPSGTELSSKSKNNS